MPSKSHRLESQARCLLKAKHKVHVLHSLSRRPFEQVVDARRHEQLVAVPFGMYKTLVGVDNLLQVNRLVNVEGERRLALKVVVVAFNLVDGRIALDNLRGKDAAWKVAAVRYKVNLTVK